LDNSSEEKWWEFVDLTKLIVANNFLTEIPSDIQRLPSLQVLDVSYTIGFKGRRSTTKF
jgi:hypothetical protein